MERQGRAFVRPDNPTLILSLGMVGEGVSAKLEGQHEELVRLGAIERRGGLAFAELDADLRQALKAAQELMAYGQLVGQRDVLERQRPRLDVVVIASLTEPLVRQHLQHRLGKLHSLLLHHMGAIFDRFRHGHDRNLTVIPVLASGYVPRDPDGPAVEHALKSLLDWVEAIPKADFANAEPGAAAEFEYAGGTVELALDLVRGKEELVAEILDEQGHKVRQLKLGLQVPGKVQIRWDGLFRSGKKAPTGRYTVRFRPRLQSSDYDGYIDQVFVLDDVTDTSVLSSAEVEENIRNFLELMLYSGLRNASDSDEHELLPAGRDWFHRVEPGERNSRLSTFSCAALDIPVFRLHRYCAQKAVLEGLRILKARPEGYDEDPVQVARRREDMSEAQASIRSLSVEPVTRQLAQDLGTKVQLDQVATEDDEEDEPEAVPLLASNEFLIQSLGPDRLDSDRKRVKGLWRHYQRWGMDQRVRSAAGKAYELADEIGTLLRQSIDIILDQKKPGMHWRAIEEVESQIREVQSGYEEALVQRDAVQLSPHPDLQPLNRANEEIVEAVEARPDPERMQFWGVVMALLVGSRLGELCFLKWGVNPLVALGDDASWIDLLRHVAVPYMGGILLGAFGVALALWFWLDRATDRVRDAYEAYLDVFRETVLGRQSDSIYRYYASRLDLLFRQEVVRANLRSVEAVHAEHQGLKGIDESLRIQIQNLETAQEALGVVINRDGTEQLGELIGTQDRTALRTPGLVENDVHAIYQRRALGVDSPDQVPHQHHEVAVQMYREAALSRGLKHLYQDFRERVPASQLDELLGFGEERASGVLEGSLIPEYARHHVVDFLTGHTPNLSTGLDWDGNVMTPLGPDRRTAVEGERARQYLMRLENQPMVTAGPADLAKWLARWEETGDLISSGRFLTVDPAADHLGHRADRENRLYLARVVQGLPLEAARSLQTLETWFDDDEGAQA